MPWLQLIVAVALIGIGLEALLLSKARVDLPDLEVDRQIWGNPPPKLDPSLKRRIYQDWVVRNGAPTQLLGVLFVLLGVVVGLSGLGLI